MSSLATRRGFSLRSVNSPRVVRLVDVVADREAGHRCRREADRVRTGPSVRRGDERGGTHTALHQVPAGGVGHLVELELEPLLAQAVRRRPLQGRLGHQLRAVEAGGRPRVEHVAGVRRQAEGDRDREPVGPVGGRPPQHRATAWSTPWLAKLLDPGANWPPLRQAESEIDCPAVGCVRRRGGRRRSRRRGRVARSRGGRRLARRRSGGPVARDPVDRDHLDRARHLVVAAQRLVLDVAAHLELHAAGAVLVAVRRDLGRREGGPHCGLGRHVLAVAGGEHLAGGGHERREVRPEPVGVSVRAHVLAPGTVPSPRAGPCRRLSRPSRGSTLPRPRTG